MVLDVPSARGLWRVSTVGDADLLGQALGAPGTSDALSS